MSDSLEVYGSRPKRKRAIRNPKRKRQFDLPESDDDQEPIIGPGADQK
jgi:hypothetical protein